jgi:hypothetical protein
MTRKRRATPSGSQNVAELAKQLLDEPVSKVNTVAALVAAIESNEEV